MSKTIENEKKIISDFLREDFIDYNKKDFVEFNGIQTIKIYNGKKIAESYEITQKLIDECKKIITLKEKYEKDFKNKKKKVLSNFTSLVKYSKNNVCEYSTISGTIHQNLKSSLIYFLNYDPKSRAILKKFIVGEINEKSESQLLGIKIELVDIFLCKQNAHNANLIKKYYIDKNKENKNNDLDEMEKGNKLIEVNKKIKVIKIDNKEEIKEEIKKESKETDKLIDSTKKDLKKKSHNNTLEKIKINKNQNIKEKKSLKPTKFKDERLDYFLKIKKLIKYDETRNVIFEKNFNEQALNIFNDEIYPKILLFFDSHNYKRIKTHDQKGFKLIMKKIFKEFNYAIVKSSFAIKDDDGNETKEFYCVIDISKMIS